VDLIEATIQAARCGNRTAQAVLLRELGDVWYRMVLRLLGDVDRASEATQETGFRFLKRLSGFEGRSGLKTWSLGIAINVAREMQRERGAEKLADVAAVDDGPDVVLEGRERAELVNRILDELPMRQREAVLLRFFEQLSVEESAQVMGCAGGTVKALVFQALRNMRRRLGSFERVKHE
jgi:RNA polymerase sigma-70 factor (ECF subfamily)